MQQVKELDDKANQIIVAAKNRYPESRIPYGEKLPQVPQELIALQQQRNSVFQHGQARLQFALGVDGFKKLDSFVKAKLGNKSTAQ